LVGLTASADTARHFDAEVLALLRDPLLGQASNQGEDIQALTVILGAHIDGLSSGEPSATAWIGVPPIDGGLLRDEDQLDSGATLLELLIFDAGNGRGDDSAKLFPSPGARVFLTAYQVEDASRHHARRSLRGAAASLLEQLLYSDDPRTQEDDPPLRFAKAWNTARSTGARSPEYEALTTYLLARDHIMALAEASATQLSKGEIPRPFRPEIQRLLSPAWVDQLSERLDRDLQSALEGVVPNTTRAIWEQLRAESERWRSELETFVSQRERELSLITLSEQLDKRAKELVQARTLPTASRPSPEPDDPLASLRDCRALLVNAREGLPMGDGDRWVPRLVLTVIALLMVPVLAGLQIALGTPDPGRPLLMYLGHRYLLVPLLTPPLSVVSALTVVGGLYALVSHVVRERTTALLTVHLDPQHGTLASEIALLAHRPGGPTSNALRELEQTVGADIAAALDRHRARIHADLSRVRYTRRCASWLRDELNSDRQQTQALSERWEIRPQDDSLFRWRLHPPASERPPHGTIDRFWEDDRCPNDERTAELFLWPERLVDLLQMGYPWRSSSPIAPDWGRFAPTSRLERAEPRLVTDNLIVISPEMKRRLDSEASAIFGVPPSHLVTARGARADRLYLVRRAALRRDV